MNTSIFMGGNSYHIVHVNDLLLSVNLSSSYGLERPVCYHFSRWFLILGRPIPWPSAAAHSSFTASIAGVLFAGFCNIFWRDVRALNCWSYVTYICLGWRITAKIFHKYFTFVPRCSAEKPWSYAMCWISLTSGCKKNWSRLDQTCCQTLWLWKHQTL